MTLAEPAPVTCTLNRSEFNTRREKLAELNRTALTHYRRDDLRLELFYAVAARPQVLEMVRGEQTCCSSLTFEIGEESDVLRVIVEAPERARAAADSLFEALYSTMASKGAFGPANAPADRVVGASAALAATGALACGVCCVLPFALPASLLAATGGIIGWLAKATPWAMWMALFAVVGGWAWVILQSIRGGRKHSRLTMLTLGFATAVFAAAMVWWHFERDIIHFLR
jgi:hypothetical protein